MVSPPLSKGITFEYRSREKTVLRIQTPMGITLDGSIQTRASAAYRSSKETWMDFSAARAFANEASSKSSRR